MINRLNLQRRVLRKSSIEIKEWIREIEKEIDAQILHKACPSEEIYIKHEVGGVTFFGEVHKKALNQLASKYRENGWTVSIQGYNCYWGYWEFILEGKIE